MRQLDAVKQGMNTITRASTQSSVTIPFERTFRDLDTNRPQTGDQLAQFNFCGCGWPQHMLVPKGTPEGLQSQLFVMISDYSGDRVCLFFEVIKLFVTGCGFRLIKTLLELAMMLEVIVESRISCTRIVGPWVIRLTGYQGQEWILFNSSSLPT